MLLQDGLVRGDDPVEGLGSVGFVRTVRDAGGEVKVHVRKRFVQEMAGNLLKMGSNTLVMP